MARNSSLASRAEIVLMNAIVPSSRTPFGFPGLIGPFRSGSRPGGQRLTGPVFCGRQLLPGLLVAQKTHTPRPRLGLLFLVQEQHDQCLLHFSRQEAERSAAALVSDPAFAIDHVKSIGHAA